MKDDRGFSVIELLVVIAVVVILIATAIPSYISFFERNRVRGAAEIVYEQLMHARTLAIKRSKPITVKFSANDTESWAVGITDKTDCTPTGNDCTIDYDNDSATSDAVKMVTTNANSKNVVMNDPSFTDDNDKIVFGAVRGFAQVGADEEIILDSASGEYEIRVVVTESGHMTLCSPSGSKKVGGFPDC